MCLSFLIENVCYMNYSCHKVDSISHSVSDYSLIVLND